jgi:hypothetical protein
MGMASILSTERREFAQFSPLKDALFEQSRLRIADAAVARRVEELSVRLAAAFAKRRA